MIVTPEQHKRLVECLQLLAKRPALFVGDHDPERIELWLSGFAVAVQLNGDIADERRQLREQVMKARGWKVTATSSWRQMLETNLTPAEIIEEMVAIEIQVLTGMCVMQK